MPQAPLTDVELTHHVVNLTETLGYVQDDLARVATTQREHTRQLARIEKVVTEHDARFDAIDGRLDGIDTRLDGIDGTLAEVLRRLPEPS